PQQQLIWLDSTHAIDEIYLIVCHLYSECLAIAGRHARDELLGKSLFDKVDSTPAKATAHHATTDDTGLATRLGYEKIEFVAAHLIQLRQSLVCLKHFS